MMKPSTLLTRRTPRRTAWTTVLLLMLLVASLTGATPGRLIPGIAKASSLAHANTNAKGISVPALASAPASATSPKQEQEQSQQLGQPARPLERVLNKDGTLNLSTGFSGSADPKGWRME